MKRLISILAASLIAMPMSVGTVNAQNNEDNEMRTITFSETDAASGHIVLDVSSDSTDIDTSSLYRDEYVTNFLVTTADADGNIISQYKTEVSDLITVDTKGAVRAEVVPVFRYEDIGSLVSEKTIRSKVENGRYNFTFKKERSERSDIYVNGKMVLNNADQAGYNRTISGGSQINVNDIVIDDGSIRLSMPDAKQSAHAVMSWCEFYRAPQISNRKTKVFVIGDSLVATYYGSEKKQYKGQFGWGEVLGSFLNDTVEVWNLAQAGNYATVLEETAYPGVIANGQAGDYFIIESGYNDTKHNDADTTRESVERMINGAKEKGMIPVVVSPNASMKKCDGTDTYFACTGDYTESVHFTGAMKQAAENTDTYFVDLSKGSYTFYHNNYGTDTAVIENTYYFPSEPDVLHHNYLGAMLCARTVIQGMYDLGIKKIVNTDFSFSYTDSGNGNVTLAVGDNKEPVREAPVTTPVPTEEPGKQSIIWDFSEYTETVKASQDPKTSTYAEIEPYNGLRIYLAVNNSKDYVDATGVHFGGAKGSNPADGSEGRYLAYTPDVPGTLYVTGYAADSKTNRWGIVAGVNGGFIGDESSTNNETDIVTVKKECVAGEIYYIYGRDGGVNITNIRFVYDAPQTENNIETDISLLNGVYKISVGKGNIVGKVAIAQYFKDQLKFIKFADYTGEAITEEFPDSTDIDKIKVMLWDSAENMKPLTGVKEFIKE